MSTALQLLNEFEASTADGFPLGKPGAEVFDEYTKAGSLRCTRQRTQTRR
jgi:hypothetical protein